MTVTELCLGLDMVRLSELKALLDGLPEDFEIADVDRVIVDYEIKLVIFKKEYADDEKRFETSSDPL